MFDVELEANKLHERFLAGMPGPEAALVFRVTNPEATSQEFMAVILRCADIGITAIRGKYPHPSEELNHDA